MPFVPPPCVLTIAGSDSGAGAGVQADARTIHALGGFACMAITAVTAQNTRGVLAWQPVSPRLLLAQIRAVTGWSAANSARGKRTPRAAGALPIAAIKTGLLPGAAAVRVVVEALGSRRSLPVVVDPVVGSTSGTRFLGPAGLRELKDHLLPRATLVTPNWPEAALLTGLPIATHEQAVIAATRLMAATGCAVLIKGGHGPGRLCRDFLVTRDGNVHEFASARVATPNTHGTGCVLSSAIATELAKGAPLVDAVESAHRFLHRSLLTHRRDRWDGAGPAFPGN